MPAPPTALPATAFPIPDPPLPPAFPPSFDAQPAASDSASPSPRARALVVISRHRLDQGWWQQALSLERAIVRRELELPHDFPLPRHLEEARRRRSRLHGCRDEDVAARELI